MTFAPEDGVSLGDRHTDCLSPHRSANLLSGCPSSGGSDNGPRPVAPGPPGCRTEREVYGGQRYLRAVVLLLPTLLGCLRRTPGQRSRQRPGLRRGVRRPRGGPRSAWPACRTTRKQAFGVVQTHGLLTGRQSRASRIGADTRTSTSGSCSRHVGTDSITAGS